MRTYYEIEMVRDARGVWTAPWERQHAWTSAGEQAAFTPSEPVTRSSQDKQSWKKWLWTLLPSLTSWTSWKGTGEYLKHQPA